MNNEEEKVKRYLYLHKKLHDCELSIIDSKDFFEYKKLQLKFKGVVLLDD